MQSDPNPHDLVRAMLGVSGIAPADAEIDAMAAGFTASRARVSALYTIPGIRYELPALTWSAES